jgi:hypothetical protein
VLHRFGLVVEFSERTDYLFGLRGSRQLAGAWEIPFPTSIDAKNRPEVLRPAFGRILSMRTVSLILENCPATQVAATKGTKSAFAD